MKKYIGEKKTWISTGGYRGHERPVNAVGGCAHTGNWSDSPCRTDVVKKEIEAFKKMLKSESIRFKTLVTKTSNVFCQHVYVLVHPDDRDRALPIASHHESNDTKLFFACNSN